MYKWANKEFSTKESLSICWHLGSCWVEITIWIWFSNMTEVCVVMIGSISGLWLEIQSEQFLCLWGTFLMWFITEGQHSGLWSVDPTLQDLMINHELLDILLSCLSNQTASGKEMKMSWDMKWQRPTIWLTQLHWAEGRSHWP